MNKAESVHPFPILFIWFGGLVTALLLRKVLHWDYMVIFGFTIFVIISIMSIVIGAFKTNDKLGMAVMSILTVLLVASAFMPSNDVSIPSSKVIGLLLIDSVMLFWFVRRFVRFRFGKGLDRQQ